jgi:hypothetical protein
VSPNTGTTGGGAIVSITGSGFLGATSVLFGIKSATSFTVRSDTWVVATAPAQAAGVVDVRVTTPSGTSPVTEADRFTYTAAPVPAVTLITPTSGPTAGGTVVTVLGSAFRGATDVKFDTTSAMTFKVLSNTALVATSPAHPTGTVHVTVTTYSGTSPAVPADQFTYTGGQGGGGGGEGLAPSRGKGGSGGGGDRLGGDGGGFGLPGGGDGFGGDGFIPPPGGGGGSSPLMPPGGGGGGGGGDGSGSGSGGSGDGGGGRAAGRGNSGNTNGDWVLVLLDGDPAMANPSGGTLAVASSLPPRRDPEGDSRLSVPHPEDGRDLLQVYHHPDGNDHPAERLDALFELLLAPEEREPLSPADVDEAFAL